MASMEQLQLPSQEKSLFSVVELQNLFNSLESHGFRDDVWLKDNVAKQLNSFAYYYSLLLELNPDNENLSPENSEKLDLIAQKNNLPGDNTVFVSQIQVLLSYLG